MNDFETFIGTVTADRLLTNAAMLLKERGETYDSGEERSATKVATAFNAITDKDITPAEVYLLLQILKDVRQWANGGYHKDSAEDCISYAALKAEELAKE